jgi:hypothetical protein
MDKYKVSLDLDIVTGFIIAEGSQAVALHGIPLHQLRFVIVVQLVRPAQIAYLQKREPEKQVLLHSAHISTTTCWCIDKVLITCF